MDISEEQLACRPKAIGSLKGHKVFEVQTKGGLYLVVKPEGKTFETLGAGPHPGISKHLAEKKNPEIVWNELAKSDQYLDPNSAIVAKYEVITNQLRSAR